jgi:hypothetical protein
MEGGSGNVEGENTPVKQIKRFNGAGGVKTFHPG